MTLAEALTWYLSLNLLIAMGFVGLETLVYGINKIKYPLKARTLLRLQYSVLTLVIFISCFQFVLPKNEIFKPVAKVWTATSIKTYPADFDTEKHGGYVSLNTGSEKPILKSEHVSAVGITLIIALVSLAFYLLFRDFKKFLKIKNQSFLIRKINRVGIYINESNSVPFSFWWSGRAYVILPSHVLTSANYKMSLYHELQHHRQNDTKWVYVLYSLKILCFLNPIIHLWNLKLSQIQEFACDETLVDQNKVESQAYIRCLVEVAQTAIDQEGNPACATGLIFGKDRHILIRRIEKMAENRGKKSGRSISLIFTATLSLMMAGAAYAAKGLVQDKRLSMSEAQALADKVENRTDFPIVMNDLVLAQLNKYVGTPEGREFMREALSRKENHKDILEEATKKYNVPEEILALPMIESGYQNLPQKPNSKNISAGLWQFIPGTARNFGLKVNGQVDERLNVEMLTDAAMRYLQANHLRFKNWHLSVLAYNIGEVNLQNEMDKAKTRDPWSLVRVIKLGDEDYLPKFMAAIIIMKNPELLK